MLHWLALWLLVRVCGRLPARLLTAAAEVAGTCAWFLSARLRRVTADHMRHALGPHTPQRERDRAARGCVRTAARNYADFARGPTLPPGGEFDALAAADGIDHFFTALDRGCGVIVFSAHLGNPEFLLRAVGRMELDLMVVTEQLAPPRLDAFVRATRAAPGVCMVGTDVAGARAALAHLHAGGVLLVLADRDLHGTGRPVAFFGERARLPTGVIELALRTQAAVVPACVLRTPGDRLLLVVAPPLALPRSGDREADVAAGMRLLAAALEAGIRRAPEQWFVLTPVWSGLAV